AVGRRFCGGLGADDGSGAGPVLHHKRLLERLAQLLAKRPREDIGRTAGAEWHDHLDRARRIILRLRRRRRPAPKPREHDERRDLLKYRHGPARLREKAKGGNWVRTRAELYSIGAGGVQGVEGKNHSPCPQRWRRSG